MYDHNGYPIYNVLTEEGKWMLIYENFVVKIRQTLYINHFTHQNITSMKVDNKNNDNV